ncbi:alpha/beta hydrolase [Robertkochia sediminum]|uniref:alpha/beta hydrolase n=1 Tax=Robertkochia sediminum TaxID=2785326 RepID=UPI0019312CB6|nr:alpha/beta fold hydrolase [Robertkochia sediminum]MBL7473460.1 alpha/beta fold hydrolase [Robertkochia sediminum]
MTSKSLSLEHLIRPAEGTITQDTPVIFMFHGYGSNEQDLFSFSGELPDHFFVISARAPYTLMPNAYAWYAINFDADQNKWSDNEQAIRSRDHIAEFIDEACDAYGLAKDKVNLIGFSQGSILSYAVALTYPEKVKNVMALSGYINPDILGEQIKTLDHSALSVYASHGSSDQVIPVSWAQRTPEFLKKLGVDHTYEEFPVGHGVAPQNFYSMLKWLDAHN